jgi:chitinase
MFQSMTSWMWPFLVIQMAAWNLAQAITLEGSLVPVETTIQLNTRSSSSGKAYVAYFIAWGIYGRNFQPADIPIEKITHLNYAFANIGADNKIALGDSYADIDKAYPGDVWETTDRKSVV